MGCPVRVVKTYPVSVHVSPARSRAAARLYYSDQGRHVETADIVAPAAD